jgi:glutathione S-transferase
MLKIYGKRQSRTGRVLWALEELGLAYQQIPVDNANGECKTPAHLALNPMGKVPVLVDDDFILTESVAISYYLAAKQSTPLWPEGLKSRARIFQWSNWAATELEFHLTLWVRERRGAGDTAVMATHLENARQVLGALEKHLAGSRYIAGENFTIGDVNTASAVAMGTSLLDMSPFPTIRAWLETCLARPAWKAVQAINEASLTAPAA